MRNNQQPKQEVQLELPGMKTGHYVHMTRDAINFPEKLRVTSPKRDKLFPQEIQLVLAI